MKQISATATLRSLPLNIVDHVLNLDSVVNNNSFLVGEKHYIEHYTFTVMLGASIHQAYQLE